LLNEQQCDNKVSSALLWISK